MNDDEAFVAEENARIKGHPNYFTNTKKMMGQLLDTCDILVQKYALRRGDFGMNKFIDSMPERFYEWVVIISKNAERVTEFEPFSDKYSRTWKEKREK